MCIKNMTHVCLYIYTLIGHLPITYMHAKRAIYKHGINVHVHIVDIHIMHMYMTVYRATLECTYSPVDKRALNLDQQVSYKNAGGL